MPENYPRRRELWFRQLIFIFEHGVTRFLVIDRLHAHTIPFIGFLIRSLWGLDLVNSVKVLEFDHLLSSIVFAILRGCSLPFVFTSEGFADTLFNWWLRIFFIMIVRVRDRVESWELYILFQLFPNPRSWRTTNKLWYLLQRCLRPPALIFLKRAVSGSGARVWALKKGFSKLRTKLDTRVLLAMQRHLRILALHYLRISWVRACHCLVFLLKPLDIVRSSGARNWPVWFVTIVSIHWVSIVWVYMLNSSERIRPKVLVSRRTWRLRRSRGTFRAMSEVGMGLISWNLFTWPVSSELMARIPQLMRSLTSRLVVVISIDPVLSDCKPALNWLLGPKRLSRVIASFCIMLIMVHFSIQSWIVTHWKTFAIWGNIIEKFVELLLVWREFFCCTWLVPGFYVWALAFSFNCVFCILIRIRPWWKVLLLHIFVFLKFQIIEWSTLSRQI